MSPKDVGLAVLIAALWGFNFIAIKLGVSELPPFAMNSLRFAVVALPGLFYVKPPKEDWRYVVAFGLALGVGQFSFLFVAVSLGLPIGLTSLVMQLQAFWTMFFAFIALREQPQARQILGAIVGFAGMGAIAYGRWQGPQLLPLMLCVLAASWWAVANVISRKARPKDTLSFLVWSSFVVPLPMAALSYVFEDHAKVVAVLAHPSWSLILSVLYIAALSTLMAYGLWNHLLNKYPAATVAPFSMLVPLFGVAGGVAVFGEVFDRYEIIGAALVICGLLYANFGPRKLWT